MRYLLGTIFCTLLVLHSAAGDDSERAAESAPFALRVNKAIERGVTALRKRQREDSSFGGLDFTAFTVYALIHSGVPPEDPAIQEAVAWMRRQQVTTTYAAAAMILALHALGDIQKSDDVLIQEAARWLVDNIHEKEGVWGYPSAPSPKGTKPDLSNTQFAVLGLWVAERHGYTAPNSIWKALALGVLPYQKEDGGFRYSLYLYGPESRMTMTTAGITVLTLALERLTRRDQRGRHGRAIRASLKRAWAYMDRRFRADGTAVGGHVWTRWGQEYNLYGIERIATLSGREEIAGKNWYREGAGYLLGQQSSNGTWVGARGSTCLALLFLRRATLTYTSGPKQRDDAAALEPVRTDPAAASAPVGPTEPGTDVPYVRKWLVIGPFPHPGDASLNAKPPIRESRVKPRENQRAGDRKWILHHSDGDRIHLSKVLGQKHHSLSYAFTWLIAGEDTEIVLWIGQCTAGRVFLDGKMVHDDPYVHGVSKVGLPVPIRLEKGSHRLLIRVEEWTRWGTSFYLRVAQPDGSVVETVRLSPDGPR